MGIFESYLAIIPICECMPVWVLFVSLDSWVCRILYCQREPDIALIHTDIHIDIQTLMACKTHRLLCQMLSCGNRWNKSTFKLDLLPDAANIMSRQMSMAARLAVAVAFRKWLTPTQLASAPRPASNSSYFPTKALPVVHATAHCHL